MTFADKADDDEFPDEDDQGDGGKAITRKELPIHVWYRIEGHQ